MTGFSAFFTEACGKRVELMEIIPGVTQIGFFNNMSNPVADAARELIAFLKSPKVVKVMRKQVMEPVLTGAGDRDGSEAASWEESARQRLLDEDPVRAARYLGPDVELDRLRQQGGGESRQRGSVQGHRKGGLSDIKRALCAVAASRLRCTAQLGTASARLAN